jgi:hypothetical protein
MIKIALDVVAFSSCSPCFFQIVWQLHQFETTHSPSHLHNGHWNYSSFNNGQNLPMGFSFSSTIV